MPDLVTLGTRVPEDLRHRVKKHCVDVRKDMQDFVREALEEKLSRETAAASGANVVLFRKAPSSD